MLEAGWTDTVRGQGSHSMEELITQASRSADEAFILGEILGGRRAFSTVAGRCSAAEAASLRRLRDEKLYRAKADSWEEYCPKYLGMSKTNANRMIRHLEEFGPSYFEVAQLTRISADQYRAIANCVVDRTLHHDGEAIALIPENGQKIAAAVHQLRKAGGKQKPVGLSSLKRPGSRRARITQLREAAIQLTAEFADLARSSPSRRDIPTLAEIRNTTLADLYAVDLLQ